MRTAFLASLTAVCLIVGCAPLDPPQKPPAPVVESTVTATARAAFRTRDTVYAEQLEAIANDVDAGSLKFDAKLQQRIEEAKAKAASDSNPDLSKVMAAEFGPKAMDNPKRVAQSLRDMAKALRP